ncbi:GH92 family glycosyl hydrolase [Granulicella paludicola]|uniref:GH92 family glycosyl hydrolase n=1 Tax=Granulicella paludicola TaxID=474951 RepID=UPI0021DF5676|nr:GH92 family glycosyl hydrolase [Granulicella paludicola]
MSELKNPLDTSRRSFLKATGLVAAAAITPAALEAQEPTVAAQEVTVAQHASTRGSGLASPVTLVSILQGTDSTPSFSRGNTLPIAARPFGMAHWTLQSSPNSPWMFQPGQRRIQGFRSTHQLSPWLGDYGQATFLPVCGAPNVDYGARATSYRPEDSLLSPHRMGMRLLRYGIDAELIPTERGALIHASYTKEEIPGFVFDVPGEKVPAPEPDAGQRTIRFRSTANSGGVQEDFACYYVLQFSAPWTAIEQKDSKNYHSTHVSFAESVRKLDVRIATSFISFEQADRNLQLELGTKSADALRAEGEQVWNGYLKRIEVEGATEEQERTLYSCLYRTLLFPRMWHEPDASGAMQHRSPYNGKVVPGVMYADHGYWDVYRAWYPMMSILFPDRLGEILQAWVNVFKEGGWLPQFPCPGYRACMTGSLIDSLFGEAAVKGIKGFDMAAAYEGLKKHATQPGNPDAGYGRRGIEEYLKYNYDPADKVEQSAAETVDAAYGDYCIAQVAKALGKNEDYAMFMKRSENWRKIFDAKTGFFRGKKADGSFLEPFSPIRWGDPYVEGAAYQHRFDAPHAMPALIEAMGGSEKVVAELEKMLTIFPEFEVGAYGSEIHEMSEMAAINFGQYAHSNQPSHHILYVFTLAGRQDRTAYWAKRVMDELYTPDVFAGDEDTGSMAAWYVLSSLGFYPLCPSKPEYVLGAPLFPRAKVHLPEGKTLVVENAYTGGRTIRTSLDGKPLLHGTLQHDEVKAGGRLRFS